VIAKRVMSPKGGAGFARLGAYVLNAKGGADPASWTRLNAYILDAGHDGEKVAWARVSNCQSDDPGWAVKEILATQARNTRSRGDKSYHLVVSFPEGERPARTQIEAIEDRLCAAIGFEEHQRVSAVHQNTDNWHLHIAINKVHPQTLLNRTPFQDHFRLQQACAELEIELGLTREPHTTGPDQQQGRAPGAARNVRGRAADFEAQQGGPSFLRWVREQAAPALLAARDSGQGWQALHRAAAAHGLEVKLRGAGLVIGHRSDTTLHIRASDVDRGLSRKALTDALGPYEAPGQAAEAATPAASYARPARTGPLYEAFQQQRQAALAARRAAIEAVRQRHQAYARELQAHHRARLHQERRTGLRGFLRRDAFRHLAAVRAEDRAERVRREADERRRVRAQHPVPTWDGYLEAEAANGNEAALATLRGRTQRRQQMDAQIMQAADATAARHVVHQHLRPVIRRDGRVVYRLKDGGVVSDEARHVRVSQLTTGAAFLALTLAADRFGNRALIVRGSDEFRAQVATLAGSKGLHVQFADGSLERQRRASRAGPSVQQGRDHGR
jgi:hypothetical protein